MKGTLKNSFTVTDKNGAKSPRFVYVIAGTTAEVADYTASIEEQYRASRQEKNAAGEPTGKMIYVSRTAYGKTVNMIKLTNGGWIIDTSEIDAQASLAARYGGNLGQAFANLAAQSMFGSTASSVTAPVIEAPAQEEIPEATTADLALASAEEKLDA